MGALDGTHIKVHVQESEKRKYRTMRMKFIYILPGWEGSVHNFGGWGVLRDAINRPYGLRVLQGMNIINIYSYATCALDP